MIDIDVHEKRTKIRVIVSIVSFAVFVALGIATAVTQNPDLKYVVLIPFIAAYIAIPRNIMLSEMNDEQTAVYQKAQLWLSYLRIAYFLIALALIAVPRFL